MKTFLLIFVSLFISLTTFASDWITVNHDDANVRLSLSYQKTTQLCPRAISPETCYSGMASPLHFNVYGVRPDSQVRIVLHSLESYLNKVQKVTFVLDLVRQPEGHFWKEFSEARRIAFDREVPLAPNEQQLIIHEKFPEPDGCIFFMQEIHLIIDGKEVTQWRLNLWDIN